MEEPLPVLLAEYAMLINRHGVNSPEAARFAKAHERDKEFVELAELSRNLKKAFVASAGRQDHR